VATLSTGEIATLLEPFLPPQASSGLSTLPPNLLDQLSVYLDLLLRWNRRVSLTSIRSPEEIVQRHFGESLFTGLHLADRLPPDARLLDYGSGAGFPGLPIQLLLPHLHVTLAESQARKAAFLREAVRALSLRTEVWPRRVEEMPTEPSFEAVTLRAVDRMDLSLEQAEGRLAPGGWLAILAGKEMETPQAAEIFALPESEYRRLILWRKP
jgi:16S rRNA (guanine527-N7)-methyltransferase